MSEFEDLRKVIVFSRLSGDSSAKVHAAMLSRLDKKEAAGEKCPGYVELEEEVNASIN